LDDMEEMDKMDNLEEAVKELGGELADAGQPEVSDAESAQQKLEAEIKEAKDSYLRLYAEFDNYRKRMQKDRAELLKYANEDLLYELLPSLDNVEIALKHVDMEHADPAVKNLAEGVNMTMRELMRALQKFGLDKIDASSGAAFNPEVHHAVSTVERDDMDENHVVDVMRQGFMYKDKVLRAAMVSVSKKPGA